MKKIQSRQLLLLIFLLPSFLQRIFIGAEISSYSEITGLSLSWLGYASHFAIILIAISDKTIFKNKIFLKYILPVTVLSLLHLLLLTQFNDDAWNAGSLGIARFLIWITACAAISYYITAEEFLNMLIKLVDISFVIIVISTIIYHISGIPFQIIFSGGTPRAQAFFTEPSTVAAFLAGYIALSIFNRDKKRIIVSVLVMFFVNSVLALLGLLVGFALGTASKRFMKKQYYRKLILILFILLMLLLFIIAAFSSDISNYAKSISNSLEGSSFADSSFYHIFVNRILQAAIEFENGVELIRNNENIAGGGLFRYTSMISLIEQMNNSWRAFTGYGLGAHAQVMLSQGKNILDFGFLPLLLSSFGYLIGATVLYWIAKQITKYHSQLSIFIIPFALLAMFNSAGGIHTYSVLLVSVFLFAKKNNNKTPKFKRDI